MSKARVLITSFHQLSPCLVKLQWFILNNIMWVLCRVERELVIEKVTGFLPLGVVFLGLLDDLISLSLFHSVKITISYLKTSATMHIKWEKQRMNLKDLTSNCWIFELNFCLVSSSGLADLENCRLLLRMQSDSKTSLTTSGFTLTWETDSNAFLSQCHHDRSSGI